MKIRSVKITSLFLSVTYFLEKSCIKSTLTMINYYFLNGYIGRREQIQILCSGPFNACSFALAMWDSRASDDFEPFFLNLCTSICVRTIFEKGMTKMVISIWMDDKHLT